MVKLVLQVFTENNQTTQVLCAIQISDLSSVFATTVLVVLLANTYPSLSFIESLPNTLGEAW